MAGRIKLRWTAEAKEELKDLYTRISREDRPAAQRLVKKIRELAKGVVEHPQIGRVVPEYENVNIRERIIGNYRIIYLLSHRGAEVIALWHSAQSHEET